VTTIVIVPETASPLPQRFRAVAGDLQSFGATAGQALDALTAQLSGSPETLLVVVQPMQPDAWFSAEQR